jgi:hypothetical protein
MLLNVVDTYNEIDEDERWDAAMEQQGMAVPTNKRTRKARAVMTKYRQSSATAQTRKSQMGSTLLRLM